MKEISRTTRISPRGKKILFEKYTRPRNLVTSAAAFKRIITICSLHFAYTLPPHTHTRSKMNFQ